MRAVDIDKRVESGQIALGSFTSHGGSRVDFRVIGDLYRLQDPRGIWSTRPAALGAQTSTLAGSFIVFRENGAITVREAIGPEATLRAAVRRRAGESDDDACARVADELASIEVNRP